jgi:hypothetical protein
MSRVPLFLMFLPRQWRANVEKFVATLERLAPDVESVLHSGSYWSKAMLGRNSTLSFWFCSVHRAKDLLASANLKDEDFSDSAFIGAWRESNKRLWLSLLDDLRMCFEEKMN